MDASVLRTREGVEALVRKHRGEEHTLHWVVWLFTEKDTQGQKLRHPNLLALADPGAKLMDREDMIRRIARTTGAFGLMLTVAVATVSGELQMAFVVDHVDPKCCGAWTASIRIHSGTAEKLPRVELGPLVEERDEARLTLLAQAVHGLLPGEMLH